MNADPTGGSRRPGPGTGEVPHEFLLDLFNSVTDGVVAVDTNLRVTAINASALEALDLVLHQALGRPVREVLRTDYGRGRCVLAETLKTRRPLADQDLLLEDTQGRHVPVMLRTSLIRSADGYIPALVDKNAVLCVGDANLSCRIRPHIVANHNRVVRTT